MKRFLFLLMTMLVLVAACSNDSGTTSKDGLIQVDLEKVTSLMEGEENGFLLIVNDADEYYVPAVEKVADDKKVLVHYYYTYQPDGEGTEEVNRPDFDYANKLKGSTLYYIQDGKVQNKLKVNSYADTQLLIEVQNFIELYQ